MMDEERTIDAYAREMGEAALARQRALAKQIYACCGWRRTQGHNPFCANAPERRKP